MKTKLNEFDNDGTSLENYGQYEYWFGRVKSFLKVAFPEGLEEFEALYSFEHWFGGLAMQRGYLEGLVAKAESEEGSSQTIPPSHHPNRRKVFIVHGHDEGAKESVARFLGQIGLEPIILHEQPNSGRTIIEKFETYSGDVAFALVLLTPDDKGATSDEAQLMPRARQNVILELGYFMGRLGRTRVCALYKGDVELPSDYQGVIYVPMDHAGAWRTRLAQELIESNVPIKLEGIVAK